MSPGLHREWRRAQAKQALPLSISSLSPTPPPPLLAHLVQLPLAGGCPCFSPWTGGTRGCRTLSNEA